MPTLAGPVMEPPPEGVIKGVPGKRANRKGLRAEFWHSEVHDLACEERDLGVQDRIWEISGSRGSRFPGEGGSCCTELIPWSVGLCVNEMLEFNGAKGQGETRGPAKYKALNKHN